MNWLAHLYFAEPTPPSRLGNLLPDLAPPDVLRALPAAYQDGITLHRRIDAFTDAHPAFRRSVERVAPPFRRYGPIVVDIVYDHFLSRRWPNVSRQGLADFIEDVYRDLAAPHPRLTPIAERRLAAIVDYDLLSTYQTLEGLRRSLDGVGSRLRRPVPLGSVLDRLASDFDPLEDDFAELFADLCIELQSRPTQ